MMEDNANKDKDKDKRAEGASSTSCAPAGSCRRTPDAHDAGQSRLSLARLHPCIVVGRPVQLSESICMLLAPRNLFFQHSVH